MYLACRVGEGHPFPRADMFPTQPGFRLAVATACIRWNEGGAIAVCVCVCNEKDTECGWRRKA